MRTRLTGARAPLVATLALLISHAPALLHAQEAPSCRNGSFPAQEAKISLAKVVGAPRTNLRSDSPPCPNETAACRGRSYVVPGDTVLAGAASGSYVCALYPGKGGGSAGYVRREEIAPQPEAKPSTLTDWVGNWRDGDNTILLRSKGGRLTASGNAYWPSANPSPSERPGGPNLGEMSGTATQSGNAASFGSGTPTDCQVNLTLLPPFLLVSDNMNCGGMNVSFTGVYRRR